jgi:hypothetical protein
MDFVVSEKVLLAPIKYTFYAERGAVKHARKLDTLMYSFVSNGYDWSCSRNQVRIELYGTNDTMKLRLPFCLRLRMNPLGHGNIQTTHYSGWPTLRACDVSL